MEGVDRVRTVWSAAVAFAVLGQPLGTLELKSVHCTCSLKSKPNVCYYTVQPLAVFSTSDPPSSLTLSLHSG